MQWTTEEVKYQLGGRLVGNLRTKNLVIQTLLKLPPDFIEYITKNSWILSSHPEAWAYTFTGSDLKNKHLIFLSDELLSQEESDIKYTIAHEIGHVILGHKNSINFRQTKEEINKQELEADQFADKYLNS
jgi:hypothetical protein